mgnify:FL=1
MSFFCNSTTSWKSRAAFFAPARRKIEIQKKFKLIQRTKRKKNRKFVHLLLNLNDLHIMPLMPRCNKHAQCGNYIQLQSPLTKSMSNTASLWARTKIQISLPLGQQDISNALLLGQDDLSNPCPMPRLQTPPPRRIHFNRCTRSTAWCNHSWFISNSW